VRISHTELDACARDPIGWLRQKLQAQPAGRRRGPNGILRDAILKFHAAAGDSDIGSTYLNNALEGHFPSSIQLDTRHRYAAYVDWCRDTRVTVAACRLRLNFDLGSDLILGGLVSRVDVTERGYRGVLLAKPGPTWRLGFRMALIQVALARRLERPESECSVGFQDLDGENLDVRDHPEDRRRSAEQMARALASRISEERRRLGV
jgi:hypothetical protein